MDSVLQVVTVFIIFCIVLFVTYYVTKWIAGYKKNQMSLQNLEVVETLRISQTKYLQIIRGGESYYLIAVCKDSITLIGELDKEQLDLNGNATTSLESFQNILKRVKTENQKKED